MTGRTCILVSAFAGYVPAALLTRRLIDRYWADHPPLWLCGTHIDDAAALPFRDDPQDWMAGVRSALRDLSVMGFERVYLIMADWDRSTRVTRAISTKRSRAG